MDFEKLVSFYKSRTCIISVEHYQDGSYGNIRIVAANKAHIDDVEQTFHRTFVPDSPYHYYLPQDKNFEDFMYRSACLGEPLHTYVHLEQMGLWVNMFLLPLDSDKEDTGYCLYSYDISPYVDTQQQASLAADTASNALEISVKLGGATNDNFEQVFEEIIEDIRKICRADHSCILLSGSGETGYVSFCAASDPESRVKPDEIIGRSDFCGIADTFESTISGSSCVIIKDENDMKWLESVNPGLHVLLMESGINNTILFPLKNNNKTFGYIWIMNFNADEVVKIKEMLELSTFIIASQLVNHQLMKQLEYLSTVDIMTGCKNRNAMNNVIDDIKTGKIEMPDQYVVIFADLNGLKRINDEKGHNAGDRLLRTASAILGQVFYDCDIYRAGGDEFMLILPEITEEDLNARFSQINNAVDTDVYFAFGYHFVRNGEDIRSAMRIADEKMYINKKEYYEQHPERKYR